MKKKKNSVLRKKYGTRDIELRVRSKRKCCTEIMWDKYRIRKENKRNVLFGNDINSCEIKKKNLLKRPCTKVVYIRCRIMMKFQEEYLAQKCSKKYHMERNEMK